MKKMNEMKWYHTIKLPSGSLTPGSHTATEEEINLRWGLPTSLKGKRVVDIGACDGFFAFECEKRGAKSVLAIDSYPNALNPECPEEPFFFAKDALKSHVDLKKMSVMNLNSYNIGQFDLALLYGVLHHLENPIEGLEKACSVIAPSGKILIETKVMNNDSTIAQLSYSNKKYYPNYAWIKRELTRLGFNTVEQFFKMDGRISVRGEK